MVAASYLKAHMTRINDICVPQTSGDNKVGRGTTKYVVSFPRVLQKGKCPVPGCLVVAHNTGRL